MLQLSLLRQNLDLNLILVVTKKWVPMFVFVFVFLGGDQSPESSAEWTPGRSPEAAALGSVCRRRSRCAACQHYFINHYLLFLFPVTALGVPPGLPQRRNGPQRCSLVAARDQPPVDRSHTSGGRGGSLEANVSGNDENLVQGVQIKEQFNILENILHFQELDEMIDTTAVSVQVVSLA